MERNGRKSQIVNSSTPIRSVHRKCHLLWNTTVDTGRTNELGTACPVEEENVE